MAYVFLLIGFGVGVFGFASMRDPLRFALFGAFQPQTEGYYQRMALDRRYRVQLRMIGMLLSFFGLMMTAEALDGLLKLKFIHVLSEAFLGLLWLSFVLTCVLGLVEAIIQGLRGRGEEMMFGWYKMWKQSMELGPVAAFPIFMPRMDTERKVFTGIFTVLVGATFLIAVVSAAWP